MDDKRRQLLRHLQPPPPGSSSPRRSFRLGFWLGHALLLAALFSLLSAAQLTGLFERAEFAAGDAAINLRGPRAPTAPIMIVAIDERSFAESGYEWPWPRDYIAKIVESIAAGKPSVLAIDILFTEPSSDESADETLASALQRTPYSILAGYAYTQASFGFYMYAVDLPIPILLDSADAVGLINGHADSDGVVRRLRTSYELGGHTYYPLTAQAESLYLHQQPYHGSSSCCDFFEKRNRLINFRGPAGTFPTMSAVSVVNGEISSKAFRDKIVLLGVTDPALHDFAPTPFGGHGRSTSGVEILANEIDTLIADDYIQRDGIEADQPSLSVLLFLLVTCLVGYFIGCSRRALVILPALAVVVVVCVLAWGVAFFALRLQLPFATPLISLVSGSALSTLRPKRFR